MAGRKRPYEPKTKGCYQCSQRRIHCDRTQPGCRKCAQKGITCSGFGFQYKFRLVESKAKDDKKADSRGDRETRKIDNVGNNNSGLVDGLCSPAGPDELLPSLLAFGLVEYTKECLLDYFPGAVSNNIAPEMVVIDNNHNGWRYLVLPVAYQDELVMNAVLAASAFHINGRGGRPIADPGEHYTQAILQLRRSQNLDQCDPQTQQSVILAILVLLVAVMVNGYTDFPLLFNMLQSALNAVGGEERLVDSEMAEFLLRQIHKMRVYGAPFVSQDAGVHALLFEARQSFDCLRYYHQLHPYHSNLFDLIANLRQQAYDIYLYRASTDHVSWQSTQLIKDFKFTLESFPGKQPGEHALVWACFIAGSESYLPADQQFFEQFLRRQYHRNGFANILKALELLKRIWKRKSHENWIALLPEPRVFIM